MTGTALNTLKESEISDAVIDSLPGIFYLQDDEGNYLRWNRQFEQISGYNAGEIRGLKPFVFFDPADHERVARAIEKVYSDGAAELNIEVITKDGSRIPFYISGKAVIYEGRRCIIGMCVDMSARAHTEKENKKNEAYLHSLFDNVGGAVFLLDTDKKLVFFNDDLARYVKMVADHTPVPGELAYNFLPPDEMKQRHELLDSVLQGKKEVVEVAYDINGQKHFFRSGYTPVIVDGKVMGISCYTLDITPSKKAERETQKLQERLNNHIDNSPLAVIEYDKQLRITFWSKRDREIFGWTEDDIIGKKITDFLIHEDDAAGMEAYVRSHEHAGEQRPISNRNYTKDGRILHCRWHSSYMTDEEGNVTSILSIVRDITDLHKAELQKEAIANDLIKRNNDLEQFTYIVSHNLRAPIARVIGLADILAEFDLSDEEKNETILGISQSAHRLDDIIKDLNTILHIRGNLNENKEIVVFSTLVAEIEQNIRHFNKDEFILETDFSAIDSHYTIKNYFVSIFSNLISNSIKYRQPDKEPVIKIRSEIADNMLILTFSDNGIGFDMDKKGNEIFGLYKRFHFHVEGKGLGLFMVKSQVETLGGKIGVASGVNKGAEFRIELGL